METRPKIKTLTLTLTLTLFCTMLVFGCTGVDQGNNDTNKKTGLQIYSMSTGLGAVSNDNIDQHRLTYTINLTNEDDKEAYIQWIEPILGMGIKDKILTEELQVVVEKNIPSKGSIEIKGVVVFNTKGLSKEEILELEPFITGIKVVSEAEIVIKT